MHCPRFVLMSPEGKYWASTSVQTLLLKINTNLKVAAKSTNDFMSINNCDQPKKRKLHIFCNFCIVLCKFYFTLIPQESFKVHLIKSYLLMRNFISEHNEYTQSTCWVWQVLYNMICCRVQNKSHMVSKSVTLFDYFFYPTVNTLCHMRYCVSVLASASPQFQTVWRCTRGDVQPNVLRTSYCSHLSRGKPCAAWLHQLNHLPVWMIVT